MIKDLIKLIITLLALPPLFAVYWILMHNSLVMPLLLMATLCVLVMLFLSAVLAIIHIEVTDDAEQYRKRN
jgi:hypothetical protein